MARHIEMTKAQSSRPQLEHTGGHSVKIHQFPCGFQQKGRATLPVSGVYTPRPKKVAEQISSTNKKLRIKIALELYFGTATGFLALTAEHKC
jgi:hypothetical protein